MKHIIHIGINIEIEADSKEEAIDQFFDANISIQKPDGEEMDWTFIEHELFEA